MLKNFLRKIGEPSMNSNNKESPKEKNPVETVRLSLGLKIQGSKTELTIEPSIEINKKFVKRFLISLIPLWISINLAKPYIVDRFILESTFEQSQENLDISKNENIKKKIFVSSKGVTVLYYENIDLPEINSNKNEQRISNALNGKILFVFTGIDGIGGSVTNDIITNNSEYVSRLIIIDYTGIKALGWNDAGITKYAQAVEEFIKTIKGIGNVPKNHQDKYIASTSFGAEFFSKMNLNIPHLTIAPFVGTSPAMVELNEEHFKVFPIHKLIFAPDQYSNFLQTNSNNSTVVIAKGDGLTGGSKEIKSKFKNVIETPGTHTRINSVYTDFGELNKSGNFIFPPTPIINNSELIAENNALQTEYQEIWKQIYREKSDVKILELKKQLVGLRHRFELLKKRLNPDYDIIPFSKLKSLK